MYKNYLNEKYIMSLNPISLYAPLDVAEKIPDGLKMKDLTAASVVKNRRTVKYVSMNGDSFSYPGSSSVITFQVSDSNSYIDLQKTCLNFVFQLTEGGTSANSAVEDALWCLFNRARLEVGSVMLEDVLQANVLTNALVYSACDKNVYENQLSLLAGAWKHNTQIPSSATVADPANATPVGAAAGNVLMGCDAVGVAARKVAAAAMQKSTASPNGYLSVSIPLSLIFGSHRTAQYFPLRNSGALRYQFFVDQLSNFINSGTPGAPTVKLSNVFLSADLLDLDPVYISAMDRVMNSVEDGETGFKLPVNTYLVADASWTGTGSHVQHNLVYSKATSQLRSLVLVKRNASDDMNKYAWGVTKFNRFDSGNPAGTGVQIRIGSDLFPQYGAAQTVAEQYRELSKTFQGLGNMFGMGLQNVVNYCNQYGADDINSAFTLAFDFTKITDETIDLDGYDSSVNGGIINVQLSDNCPNAKSITYTAGIEFTRHLVIGKGQVQVVG